MSWETIENVKPPAASKLPPHGVVVTPRRAMKDCRFITIKIGPDLARAVRFHAEAQAVRLMFGSGSDAGKIAVAMDMGGGLRREEAEDRRLFADDQSRRRRAVQPRLSGIHARPLRGDPARQWPAADVRDPGQHSDAGGGRVTAHG